MNGRMEGRKEGRKMAIRRSLLELGDSLCHGMFCSKTVSAYCSRLRKLPATDGNTRQRRMGKQRKQRNQTLKGLHTDTRATESTSTHPRQTCSSLSSSTEEEKRQTKKQSGLKSFRVSGREDRKRMDGGRMGGREEIPGGKIPSLSSSSFFTSFHPIIQKIAEGPLMGKPWLTS